MIAAETAWRMMTKRDPHVNMLRTTIAVAAAGLGGADADNEVPQHTAPLGLPDAFARRVARNTQLVLLEESNLARVGDPAAGSGALEAMTHELCTAAWSAFREIERAGGVWAALETGLIQRHAAAVRAERERAVARRTDILTGTNEYPNINEVLPTVLDVAPAALPKENRCGHRGGTAAHPARRTVRTASRRVGQNPGRRPARGRKCSSPPSASPPTSTPAPTSPRTFSKPAASKRPAARTVPPRSPPGQHPPVSIGVHERGERLGSLPDRHVHDDPRAARLIPLEGAHRGGVAVFGLQPPHEPGRGVRRRVDRIERGHETGELRAVERSPQPPDVHLRQHIVHPAMLPSFRS